MYSMLIPNLCIILFAIVSFIHLGSCITGKAKERLTDISKLTLMPLLLLFYLIYCIYAAQPFYWSIICALLLSTLGDYYLLNEKSRDWIRWGMTAFTVAQISYILFAAPKIRWNQINLWVIIGISFAYVIVCTYSIISTLPHTKENGKMTVITIPTIVYTITLCVMSYFFVLLSAQYTTIPTTLLAAGGLLFVCSDFLLSRRLFMADFPQSRFLVMLTYLLAQSSIIIGVSLFTQAL